MILLRRFLFPLIILLLGGPLLAQLDTPNHPEIDWYTLETEHFLIHYYDATERTARVGATIAEEIYGPVTDLYEVGFDSKVHLIFKDTDDYSNGAAYYYDNKIVIWAMPLDFELRGSHNWLRDVITHEFTHIVQLNASMKFTRKIPAFYFQVIQPEKEHREDVVYGYPNTVISYPFAGTVIPPWFAEGTAQYNARETPYDYWDSHRDMILRDRVLHNDLLSWDEMSVFGKSGTGNESVYNQGYALVSHLARRYGDHSLKRVTAEMQGPLATSFNKAMKNAVGTPGREIYQSWADSLHHYYRSKTELIRQDTLTTTILSGESTGNFYPRWSPEDSLIAYLSNAGNDYLSQTALYIQDPDTGKPVPISGFVTGSPGWSPDGSMLAYARRSSPDRFGSVYDDLYVYDLQAREEERLTRSMRVKNPDWSPGDSLICYVSSHDGTQNIHIYDFQTDTSRKLTGFSKGEQIFAPRFSSDGSSIVFDINLRLGRDIYTVDVETGEVTPLLDNRWDERNPVLRGDTLYYASDKTGIFNIYRKDLSSGKTVGLTNVPGGAFMPDPSGEGSIAFSLYQNGGYRLALFTPESPVPEQRLRYKDYPATIPESQYALNPQLETDGRKYNSQYSQMFIIPRLLYEYGTIKPGLYFYSTEVLDQMDVLGGASVNRLGDLDLYLAFNYNQLKPTLYADISFLTRNITEKIDLYRTPSGEDYIREDADLRFTLMQTNFGASGKWFRFPWGELEWDIYGRYEQYSTFIKYLLSEERLEAVLGQNYLSKLRYEYYIGRQMHLELGWNPLPERARRLSYIRPTNYLSTSLHYSYERNEFINDFTIGSSGVLQEVYEPNYYHKIEGEIDGAWTLPFWQKSNLSFDMQGGWISDNSVDDFFYLFGGGLPGLKGYPFYSIEGTHLGIGSLQWNIPLLTGVNYRLVQFNFQDIYLSPYLQYGDAWSGGPGEFRGYGNTGAQLRIGGFSFYSYPTAITVDAAYGWDQFTLPDTPGTYGQEWRFYFTLLFEFDQL